MRTNLFELSPEDLETWLAERGERSFRLKQILDWVYKEYAGSFEDMTNLSKDLRADLSRSFAIGSARSVDSARSGDGSTVKSLLEFPDGEHVECVLMRDGRRKSVCLSSQSGCAMGCRFCATGQGGTGRNLTGGEIVEQAWRLAREAQGFTHVVFMGMGEPLLNLEAVSKAIQALADERRFGIGARRITLSTCGIGAKIDALQHASVSPQLALSLNSPFDGERQELMPGTRRHALDQVLAECRRYREATGRHLTFEYVLLEGVNDSRRHARRLAEMAQEDGARVNLIAFNPVEGLPYRPPDGRKMSLFKNWLEQERASVSVRYRRGRDILAGCGQLRGNRGSRSQNAGGGAAP